MEFTIKHIIWGVALLAGLSSCTKYNYIDTGRANGVHDCTMWEYFHTDSYDWDSTILMIEHAGMKAVFDGTGEYKQITFFAPTNLSIETCILDHNQGLEETDPDYWYGVTDMDPDWCKQLLEKLIVPGRRVMLEDVPKGTRVQEGTEGGLGVYKEEGGCVLPTVGEELFAWTTRDVWHEVDESGAKILWIARRNQAASNWRVASSDIQTTTGVVQALGYDFDLMKFLNY